MGISKDESSRYQQLAAMLLWALGVNVRPPHYATFASYALLMGGFWGAGMTLFMAFNGVNLRGGSLLDHLPTAAAVSLPTGVGLGIALAFVVRRQALKAGLPSWDEVEVGAP